MHTYKDHLGDEFRSVVTMIEEDCEDDAMFQTIVAAIRDGGVSDEVETQDTKTNFDLVFSTEDFLPKAWLMRLDDLITKSDVEWYEDLYDLCMHDEEKAVQKVVDLIGLPN